MIDAKINHNFKNKKMSYIAVLSLFITFSLALVVIYTWNWSVFIKKEEAILSGATNTIINSVVYDLEKSLSMADAIKQKIISKPKDLSCRSSARVDFESKWHQRVLQNPSFLIENLNCSPSITITQKLSR